MKSIKTKILASILLSVFISVAAVGGVSVFLNYSSTVDTLDQLMRETAQVAARSVTEELHAYKNIALETGSVARLANSEVSVADKKSIVDQRAKTHGLQRGNVLRLNGDSLFDGNNYADREYFQHAVKGETFVSVPVISKVTGQLSIMVAAPLWEGGLPQSNKVAGVVYYVPVETFLNDIVKEINISPNSTCFILDKNGVNIAYHDLELVKRQENIIEMAKTDAGLKEMAALESRMIAGEEGFGAYRYNGESKYMAFAPIEGTDGWSLAVTAPQNDFLASTILGIVITIILSVAAMTIAGFAAISIAKRIAEPIKLCANRLELLASGDLHADVPSVTAKDETAILASSTAALATNMKMIITDADKLLRGMASGDFTVLSSCESSYVGDFSGLIESMRTLKRRMTHTLTQIHEASDQVASGSEQVSSGAQALSQGATEQASSIEELAATFNEISDHIQNSAKNAEGANQQAQNTAAELEGGKVQMTKMADAMKDINDTASEIGKIIKTIEDIAFQTNILALNAAVEAARAGEAGKGFAVVADEVRNLASKSAEASKNTAALIERTIQAVKGGAQITEETVNSLERIVDSSEKTAKLIIEISNESAQQASSVAQVTVGIDQISSVVQTNSATAEQSAAASEELSGQAQTLKELVAHFKLDNSAAASESTAKRAALPQQSEVSVLDKDKY